MSSHQSRDSNASVSPGASPDPDSKKRRQSNANLDANGNPKPIKRRAAKACAACRARKVRCDVMQRYHVTADGEVTCSNCTMDGIKCVIEESKRRKKHLSNAQPADTPRTTTQAPTIDDALPWKNSLVNPNEIASSEARRWSGSTTMSNDLGSGDFTNSAHVSHSIYQNVNQQIKKYQIVPRSTFADSCYDPDVLINSASLGGDRVASRINTSQLPEAPMLKHKLPDYLKPLPRRMTSVDIDYLFAKGALSLPDIPVRNALIRAYLEYVHPYMPLIEIHELLRIVQDGTGESGKLSLLLFQAIMFAGTSFVDMEYLVSAGYTNRKAARKAFFQKARVLFDFDYEFDRVALVQSLLLMTYWYETPDDQKDTWHWMGVAISLAHTIGLHRNPAQSNMEPNKKKLWKRIWWSCFMRDRLVALGMRRPTRVKDEDFDVPMLTEDDFEIAPVSDDITIIPMDCTVVRSVEAQRMLAQMCIAKAKLSLCISHVLTAQYSVLWKSQGIHEGNSRAIVMLFPKKLDQTDEVRRCDEELKTWVDELPESCLYSDQLHSTGPSVFVQRSLLHMVYFTTLSALHRPQVLPSASSTQPAECRELQDLSRLKVREASREITRISQNLHQRGLEKYLPTTGVTVLLPAIIIHLLDIKASNNEARQAAMDGFVQCMRVLENLRENYASADFATQFLEAAMRKADIDVVTGHSASRPRPEDAEATTFASMKTKEMRERSRASRHTPPPSGQDHVFAFGFGGSGMIDIGIPVGRPSHHDVISAPTPPDSEGHTNLTSTTTAPTPDANLHDLDFLINANAADIDMNDYVNFDTGNDLWAMPMEHGPHGESGGSMGDMDWFDQSIPTWSRLNSPIRDLGETEKVQDTAVQWEGFKNTAMKQHEKFDPIIGTQPSIEIGEVM